jgi:hypothetical protein
LAFILIGAYLPEVWLKVRERREKRNTPPSA